MVTILDQFKPLDIQSVLKAVKSTKSYQKESLGESAFKRGSTYINIGAE